MDKLNELVEQAKFIADWYGSDWSSALCQKKDGKQAHEIICESWGESVISTGSNSNEASWLCDYLELCGPENILAIAEAFRELEKRAEAAEAESKKHHAAWRQAEWVISGEQQNVRVLQGRETALNAEILTLKALIPANEQEPAAWLVGGWAYENKKAAERRSEYDNLLMEPLYTHPAPAAVAVDGSKLGEWLSNEFGIHPQQYAAYISSFYQEVMQTHEVPAGMLRRIKGT